MGAVPFIINVTVYRKVYRKLNEHDVVSSLQYEEN